MFGVNISYTYTHTQGGKKIIIIKRMERMRVNEKASVLCVCVFEQQKKKVAHAKGAKASDTNKVPANITHFVYC